MLSMVFIGQTYHAPIPLKTVKQPRAEPIRLTSTHASVPDFDLIVALIAFRVVRGNRNCCKKYTKIIDQAKICIRFGHENIRAEHRIACIFLFKKKFLIHRISKLSRISDSIEYFILLHDATGVTNFII